MYMKMGKTEKAKNLDKAVVEQTIKCFEDLIKSALEVGGRSRFRTIKQIAGQAEMLISMTGDRVSDHSPAQVQPLMGVLTNGDYGGDGYDEDVGEGLGALLQHPPRLGQDDIMRQLIDAIGPLMEFVVGKEKFESRRNNAIELNYLMDGRERIAKLSGVPDKDTMLHHMDDRIRTILDKISKKENDDAVVSSKLLRGHQADGRVDGEGSQDIPVLGAPQPVGEEGAGRPSREGPQEEVGPGEPG